jgi:hypothetical protein
MADGNCTLVARRHPLDSDVVCCEFRAGLTIAEMLGRGVAATASVTCGGYPVPREAWARVRPKAGVTLHVVVYPQGGNGGKLLKLVAIVAISYFTMGAGSTATAAWLGVSTTTLGMIGMVAILGINALIPPPTPKGLGGGGDPFQQINSLTGTSNQAAPYGVVPCVVGILPDYFPPHAAMPYTEISGDDQYMRMLLDNGSGDDLDISDIVIGETPIENFDGVDYEVTRTPTIFTQDIYELGVGTTLGHLQSDTRTTQENTTEISIDLVFPQGLYAVTSKGKFVAASVFVNVEFRKVGTETWFGVAPPTPGITLSSDAIKPYNLSVYKITSSANKALRVGLRWKTAAGQYDVRVIQNGEDWVPSVTQSLTIVWTALRSVSPGLPSTTDTLKTAARIKATDQLQGVVQNMKCRAAQRIKTYDPATQTWSDPVETQNPGWIYIWLMTACPAVARRVPTSRMDLPGLADWAAECEAKGYKVSFAMDSARALDDIRRDVLAAGRASPGQRNGLYSAVRDLPQTVPAQMFTPANSWGFSYSRAFIEPPHALRVKFTNPQANSQQDYVVVYWDGYDASNATRFDELDLSIVVDPAAAWRLGRYHLAVMHYRMTQYKFTADVEHMVCEVGDLVHAAHAIIGRGLAWGRVKGVVGARVVLEGPFTPEAGKTYGLRVRRATNEQAEYAASPIVTWDSSLITFDNSTSIDDITGPTAVFVSDASLVVEPGDLYTLGEANLVTAPLIVRAIEPAEDFKATLTCVDAAPQVLTADAGTPPPFVSAITGKSWCAAPDVPVLNVRVGTSVPDRGGLSHNEADVSSNQQSGIYRMPLYRRRTLWMAR